MYERSITGTVDWTQYHIVLDVARGAKHIAFGVLLNCSGIIWMDDFNFEEVGLNVPVTELKDKDEDELTEPSNLSFDE